MAKVVFLLLSLLLLLLFFFSFFFFFFFFFFLLLLNPNSLITCAPSNRLKSMWTPSKKRFTLPFFLHYSDERSLFLKNLRNLSVYHLRGIGIPDLKRESLEQFNASLDITAARVNSIVTQSSIIPARELMEERKCEVNVKRRAAAKSRIERIDESLSPDLLQAVQQTRDKGASSWLNALPIEEHGLAEQAGV